MDDKRKRQIIEEASAYWKNDLAFQAGGVIFETIPVHRRHTWAYEILNLAYAHFPKDPRIEAVLEFAEHPQKWDGDDESTQTAHQIVDEVNRIYGSPIFRLAVQAGKIVYTAQQYPAPFDHSAGWEIARVLKYITQQLQDPVFEAKAWLALANESFIELEEPVACHPACPTCEMRWRT